LGCGQAIKEPVRPLLTEEQLDIYIQQKNNQKALEEIIQEAIEVQTDLKEAESEIESIK
jgi:hypothetical protein